jgi:hypothetical protein
VSLTSSIGEPKGVSPVARLAPAAAVKAVERCPGFKKQLANIVPHLTYYFDKDAARWRLVFFLEDVPVTPKQRRDAAKPAPQYMDYIVDADTGRWSQNCGRPAGATLEQTIDGRKHQSKVKPKGQKDSQDTSVNVQTFDFN